MPQTARPIADVSTGGWTPTPASPADLYSHLNEPSPDSASFVTSPAGGGAFEVKLGPVFTPRTDTGQPVTLTVWLRQTGTGAAAVIDLYQGATRVARKSVTAVPGTFGPVALVLTPDEAAAITNWQDLRARVTQPVTATVPGCVGGACLEYPLVMRATVVAPGCPEIDGLTATATATPGSFYSYQWDFPALINTANYGGVGNTFYVDNVSCAINVDGGYYPKVSPGETFANHGVSLDSCSPFRVTQYYTTPTVGTCSIVSVSVVFTPA